MSDGTLPFVAKALEYARKEGKFLPQFLELEEMEKDWDVFKDLIPLLKEAQQLRSGLDDTVMLAGSEVYLGALTYYNSVKYGAKVNGAKVIFEDLKQRFLKSTRESSNGTQN